MSGVYCAVIRPAGGRRISTRQSGKGIALGAPCRTRPCDQSRYHDARGTGRRWIATTGRVRLVGGIVGHGRLVPPQRRGRLCGIPDRDHLPPPIAGRNRKIFRRAPTPIGNLEGLRRTPPVRSEVGRTEPHRRHLAATGPASQTQAASAGGVEPGGRGHSTIFSARARTDGGKVRPRAFAVLRLSASASTVACSIGRSAGFAPLKIRSMYAATRRATQRSWLHTPSARRPPRVPPTGRSWVGDVSRPAR
jgi:hypothetical protein